MKQLIQNFKTGKLYVGEVPIPSITGKYVLVENKYSLLSAGTEKSKVSVGNASLAGKATQRSDFVKPILSTIIQECQKIKMS